MHVLRNHKYTNPFDFKFSKWVTYVLVDRRPCWRGKNKITKKTGSSQAPYSEVPSEAVYALASETHALSQLCHLPPLDFKQVLRASFYSSVKQE